MKNLAIRAVQAATYCVLALPARLLFRVRRQGDLAIEPGSRYIIASNHPTRLDPFLVAFSLPPRTFFPITPIRFLTAEEYMRGPLAKIVMLPLGCVSTAKQSEKPLTMLKRMLERGESAYIFPGGMLERPGRTITPRVGVVHLAKNVPDAKIVPVEISCERISIGGVFRRKARFRVHVKRPYRPESFPEDLQPAAEEVMARIRS